MDFRGKKGSILLEASLIYPLIFLTMISVICFVICMYMASITKAELDVELKAKNLEENKIGSMEQENFHKMATDKYSGQVLMQGCSITKSRIKGQPVLEGVKSKQYKSYGINLLNMSRNHYTRIYDVNEQKYIRKLDMVFQ